MQRFERNFCRHGLQVVAFVSHCLLIYAVADSASYIVLCFCCYCINSFYFVDNQLVMHNKASYKYTREDAAQAKKSYEQRYGSKGSKTRKAASASSKAHDDSSDDDDEPDGEAKQGADAKVRYF
jgi:hypothetical protein